MKISSKNCVQEIRSLDAFSTFGALSAVAGAVTRTGKLPEPWKELYGSQREGRDVIYTVLSYDTPIAWVLMDDTAIIPGVRYSTTTSKHQGYARRGLASAYRQVIETEKDTEAPGMDRRPRISPRSGEGALYSPEYLRAKTPASS